MRPLQAENFPPAGKFNVARCRRQVGAIRRKDDTGIPITLIGVIGNGRDVATFRFGAPVERGFIATRPGRHTRPDLTATTHPAKGAAAMAILL